MGSTNKKHGITKDKGEAKVEFSGKNITPYGGFGLFGKFVRKLGVEKVLAKVSTNAPEGRYPMSRKIMSLIHGLVCGLERPSDTEVLRQDKVFQRVIGYEDYPHQTTFSRFLKALSVSASQADRRQRRPNATSGQERFPGLFQADFRFRLSC